MKSFIIVIASLLVASQASAMDIQVCNLNTDYGYDVGPDQIRVNDSKGRVLSITKSAITLNGKVVGGKTRAEDIAKLGASLRNAIPAAVEVSRLSYNLSLAGLSKDFYSRHREERWVPYVRAYRQDMRQRFKAQISTQPRLVITRGGLAAVGESLHAISRTGLNTSTLQSIKPAAGSNVSLEADMASLEAENDDRAMENAAATLCQRIKALDAIESTLFPAPGIGFDLAITNLDK